MFKKYLKAVAIAPLVMGIAACDGTRSIPPIFGYVGGTASVTGFQVNNTNSVLSANATAVAPAANPLTITNNAADIAVNPSKTFVYSVGGTSISVASIGGDGNLTLVGNFSPAGLQTASSVAITPDGRYMYVTDATAAANKIFAFSLHPTTGVPSSIVGSPFANGAATNTLRDVAVAPATTGFPSGRFLYVADSTDGGIQALPITQATGALGAVTTTAFAAATSVAIAPNGLSLHAANATTGLAHFTVNTTTGALTAFAGTPTTTLTGTISRLGVSTSSGFLFAANSAANGGVNSLTINQTTGTVAAVAGSPFLTGTATDTLVGLTVGQNGAFLLASNSNALTRSVVAYTIGSTGVLTPGTATITTATAATRGIASIQ